MLAVLAGGVGVVSVLEREGGRGVSVGGLGDGGIVRGVGDGGGVEERREGRGGGRGRGVKMKGCACMMSFHKSQAVDR